MIEVVRCAVHPTIPTRILHDLHDLSDGRHVITSVAVGANGAETAVFAADKHGEISDDWAELAVIPRPHAHREAISQFLRSENAK